jgi:hypothetical protein
VLERPECGISVQSFSSGPGRVVGAIAFDKEDEIIVQAVDCDYLATLGACGHLVSLGACCAACCSTTTLVLCHGTPVGRAI